MNRIAIVGSPGSGKSTFARQLGDQLGIEVTHLDSHFWNPGWLETPQEVWKMRHGELTARERWILDGTYLRTIDARLERADTVITFQSSRWGCLYRVIRRIITNYGKDVQANGCPERFDFEFLKYVWDFPKDYQPLIDEAIEKNRHNLRIVRLRSSAEFEVPA
jgi:adenylate kinase family enzyme